MSVPEELGIPSIETVPPEAAGMWPIWQERHPQLRVVDADGLRAWLRAVPPEESDRVLLVLAQLASPARERDRLAGLALVWSLLPAACLLARHLRQLSSRIDMIVAEHLWIEACSFAWPTRTKVAANVIADVRSQVLHELGASAARRPAELMIAATSPVADLEHVGSPELQGSAQTVLASLLDRAARSGVISLPDRTLLRDVVEAAHGLDRIGASRGLGGLSGEASRLVATRRGVSSRTVRRHLRQVVEALAQMNSGRCSPAEVRQPRRPTFSEAQARPANPAPMARSQHSPEPLSSPDDAVR